MKYAIVQSGTRQLKAEEGMIVAVDKIREEAGAKVTFPAILLSDEGKVRVGNPLVDGVTVEGTVVEHVRGKKIRVFKYKPKKRYRRTQGHRQDFTRVRIDKVAP